jgi:4-hydroxy-4-methyl-2-oxoglutarate aldolase
VPSVDGQWYIELAELGVATVYEASGQRGLIDVDLTRVVPGSRAAGPARTVRCAHGDNLMVHAVLARAEPGDVLVLTMPRPEPIALLGDILATQAKVRGVAAVLIDAAVRDVDELVELGLPIWTRYVRARGPVKVEAGTIDEPVTIGDTVIRPGDVVVLDGDGAVVVDRERVPEVLQAARGRAEQETEKLAQLEQGELTYDLYGLRDLVERKE